MDPVLAILAVLVLALGAAGFGLVRRLDGMRAELARLERLDALEQRVEALAAQLAAGELGTRLETRLDELGEAQRMLAAALSDLRQRLTASRAARPRGGPPVDPVHEHLQRLGFDDVRLLTDVEALPERSGRVVFEARRSGVVHKGYVELASGQPLSEQVQSAHGAFP